MKILALDLGTKTGYCLGSSADWLVHDTMSFKVKGSEGPGQRYLKFHVWLRNLIREENIKFVYYEAVKRHRGVIAAHVYGGLLSQVQMICEAEKVQYAGVGVGTIKKHATGKGNADKGMMINACIAIDQTPIDDNAADAICLWHYASGVKMSV